MTHMPPHDPRAFGARPEGDGVDFRLWAPAASTVEVEFPHDPGSTTRLRRLPRGWFEGRAVGAGPGTLYCYRADGGEPFPDPASRFQPRGVAGPSQVVDPGAFSWNAGEWRGRPWHEAVLYELHVGTFTPEGSFDGVRTRLEHLESLGVTALQLMPVSTFAGSRGWGYDGVLPFAPHHAYGTPDDLRRLVDAAHSRGIMVLLDVVLNHFGPEGNRLPEYAPDFFTDDFDTPWGPGIDFSRLQVRAYFVANALHWLEEYRLDGLRLDALHAIRDESPTHIVDELAQAVEARLGEKRHIHLIAENGANETRFLARQADGSPRCCTAQWNDDLHHALHVVATGETDGYYRSYADDPLRHVGRCLAEGFSYQGEPYPQWRGHPRGQFSRHLPPTAFVSFLQNHDQVGNRALGRRITELAPPEVVEALMAILLLAPSPPLLFMGEEWAAREPFPFFCDFDDDLGRQVREGRLREFGRFAAFRDPETRQRIPDPNDPTTFQSAVLDWDAPGQPPHHRRLALYRELLELRHHWIVPRLAAIPPRPARWRRVGRGGLRVRWTLADRSELTLLANLSSDPSEQEVATPRGRRLLEIPRARHDPTHRIDTRRLGPWTVLWGLHLRVHDQDVSRYPPTRSARTQHSVESGGM